MRVELRRDTSGAYVIQGRSGSHRGEVLRRLGPGEEASLVECLFESDAGQPVVRGRLVSSPLSDLLPPGLEVVGVDYKSKSRFFHRTDVPGPLYSAKAVVVTGGKLWAVDPVGVEEVASPD